jgi:hypothetical protein
MRLDKRHLAGALTLLGGSVVYNVWVLANPTSGDARPPLAAVAPAEVPVVVTTMDRPAIARPAVAPPDVAFERPPVWPRDPFEGVQVEPPPVASDPAPVRVLPAAPEPAEPELVLNSVLYSESRKLAMVNGRTVRIGQQIAGVTVLDIRPDAIVVRSLSGGVRTIERRAAAARPGRE